MYIAVAKANGNAMAVPRAVKINVPTIGVRIPPDVASIAEETGAVVKNEREITSCPKYITAQMMNRHTAATMTVDSAEYV